MTVQYSAHHRCQHKTSWKRAKFTAVQSWNVKTGLSHESEQTDCLQGNSLAAGVWTGDNKQIKFITQTDIDWNDFFSC